MNGRALFFSPISISFLPPYFTSLLDISHHTGTCMMRKHIYPVEVKVGVTGQSEIRRGEGEWGATIPLSKNQCLWTNIYDHAGNLLSADNFRLGSKICFTIYHINQMADKNVEKIPSEMKVAPNYKLLALLTLHYRLANEN